MSTKLPQNTSTPSETELEKVVQRVAATTGKSVEVVRVFARISDPRRKAAYSLEAALKAFSCKPKRTEAAD